MQILTTLSLEELSILLKEKKMSTNNTNLIIPPGTDSSQFVDYITDKLGYKGFVLCIIGEISEENLRKLYGLDPALSTNKVAMEIKIKESDALYLDSKEIEAAIECIDLGLDPEDIVEQLDLAVKNGKNASEQIVCIPFIQEPQAEKITALTQEIRVDNMKFVYIDGSKIL